MKRVDAIEELEMEGTGCVAVNLAARTGLHCHDGDNFNHTPWALNLSLGAQISSFKCGSDALRHQLRRL